MVVILALTLLTSLSHLQFPITSPVLTNISDLLAIRLDVHLPDSIEQAAADSAFWVLNPTSCAPMQSALKKGPAK